MPISDLSPRRDTQKTKTKRNETGLLLEMRSGSWAGAPRLSGPSSPCPPTLTRYVKDVKGVGLSACPVLSVFFFVCLFYSWFVLSLRFVFLSFRSSVFLLVSSGVCSFARSFFGVPVCGSRRLGWPALAPARQSQPSPFLHPSYPVPPLPFPTFMPWHIRPPWKRASICNITFTADLFPLF